METKGKLFSEVSLSRDANRTIFFPSWGIFLLMLLLVLVVFIFGVFFYGFESAVLKEGLTIWCWEQSAFKRHDWFAHRSMPR